MTPIVDRWVTTRSLGPSNYITPRSPNDVPKHCLDIVRFNGRRTAVRVRSRESMGSGAKTEAECHFLCSRVSGSTVVFETPASETRAAQRSREHPTEVHAPN